MELKNRYTEARRRLGMLPAQPVVSAQMLGRVEGQISSNDNQAQVVQVRDILSSIATLTPVEPTKWREEEVFTGTEPLTAKAIINATAEAACVPVAALLGPRREYTLTAWRQVCFYLIVTLRPDLSYPTIGRVVNRDHTTVMHGHAKVAQNLSNYSAQLTAILDRVITQ